MPSIHYALEQDTKANLDYFCKASQIIKKQKA